MARPRVIPKVVDVMNQLYAAQALVRKLREEKSDHAWTNVECNLLYQLCQVLEVDEQVTTSSSRRSSDGQKQKA